MKKKVNIIVLIIGIILLIVLNSRQYEIAIKTCVASGNSEEYCMERLK